MRSFLRTLGLSADEMLAASSGCYLLTLPADATVDIELAAEYADAAAEALGAHDLPRAVAAARFARAIARAPLLPGLEGTWAERRRAALRETLVRSLEVLADAHLAADRGELAVPAARELVGLEPFRESAHLRLLRALAAAGDRGEALRAYERCRRLLAEELGIDPSVDLELAYLELLRSEHASPGSPAAVPVAPGMPARSDFVGRTRELALLRAAWEAARSGRRRVMLITGEAGIGKSRLAAELAELAERDGASVLRGRCDEQLRVAHLPFRQAIGHHLAGCTPGRLGGLVGRGGERGRLWPEMAWRTQGLPVPADGPDTERYLLFEAVTRLLEAIAAEAPAVLIVDDLHWADEPSLDLLRHLARTPGPAALLIVATCRSDEQHGDHLSAVLADLLREPEVQQVRLGGLAVAEIGTLADATAGRPVEAGRTGLARVVHERTDGNPFLAGEMLRHVTGADVPGDAGTPLIGVATDGVPDTVRLVVAQRLARLDGQVRHAVEAAAVIGRESDLPVLARVVDLGADDLLGVLEGAVGAGLLDACPGLPGRYVFHHAIVQDAVYTCLPAARRALLHHRVGAALEDSPAARYRVPELADHFAMGSECEDAAKAVRYAHRAGDQALARQRYEEAAHRYQQALAALDRTELDGTGRNELLPALRDGLARARAGLPVRRAPA